MNKIINSIKINYLKPSLLDKINNNKLVVYNRPNEILLYNKPISIKSFRKIIKITILINKLI